MFYDIHNRRHHGMHRHHREGRGPNEEGFGPFEGFGRGRGRHGLHGGRKLSSHDLQCLLLLLLEKQPAHGYELIKSLEEKSDGFYVPSPGMIYPALTYLEELGHAEVEAEGTKKRYRLTEAGLLELNKNREAIEALLGRLEAIGKRMGDARRAFAGELDEGDEWRGGGEAIHRARHELRGLFRGRRRLDADEARRWAEVLHAAAARIRGEELPPDPDALFTAIAHRRSMGLSKLKPDPVDRKLIERMLEAANWAPSHEDTEPWRFAVFSGEGREKLADFFEAAHLAEGRGTEPAGARKRAFAAPVWIALGMVPKLRPDGGHETSEEEELLATACAIQNLHLMASAQGLAGMWHSKGPSVSPTVAKALGWEPPARLLGFMMLGWPSVEWPSGSRGPIEDKVRWFES